MFREENYSWQSPGQALSVIRDDDGLEVPKGPSRTKMPHRLSLSSHSWFGKGMCDFQSQMPEVTSISTS